MDGANPINPGDLFSAKDQVIVITGGGTGIGRALAHALAHSGASKVYLLSRRLEVIQQAAESINASTVKAIQCDVTSPESIAAAVTEIESETSHVDVLINNAGIFGPDHTGIIEAQTIGDLQKRLLNDWSRWDPTWQTNTSAVIGVSAAFLHMLDEGNKKRGWLTGRRRVQQRAPDADPNANDPRTSQIITVASVAAFNRVVTAGLAYMASKSAAVMLGKAMSTFLAPWGIRSNVICPGRFPSAMTEGFAVTFPVDRVPAGVQGSYEDIAGLVLFMVGKSGAYHNGNVQVMDGGRLAVMPGTY